MRYLFALLFFLSAQNAYAIRDPNDQEKLYIGDQLGIARQAEADIKEKDIALNIAKRTGDWTAVGNLYVKIQDLKKERQTANDKAIWLTINACGLLPTDKDGVPTPPEGVSVYRSPEAKAGKKITWIPRFEDADDFSVQDKDGNNIPERYKPGSNVFGNTASDGVSRIFPGAFTSVAELASIILHEKVHFEQNTTPGLADKKTPGELEVLAYEEEKKLLEGGVLQFNPVAKARQQARLTVMIAQKTAQANAERAKVNRENGKRIDEFSILSHSKGDLKDIMDGAAKLAYMMAAAAKERHLIALYQLAYHACSEVSRSQPSDDLQLEFKELRFLPSTAYPPLSMTVSTACGENLHLELLEVLRNGGALDLISLKQGAAMHQSRHNRLKPSPPIVPPVPTAPEPPGATIPGRTLAESLWDLAWVSCETPLKVTREFFAEKLVGFPDGSDYSKRFNNATPGCAKELYLILSDKNVKRDTVDFDWLGQKVTELKSPGGGSNGGQGGRSEPHRGSPPGNGPRLDPPDFRR